MTKLVSPHFTTLRNVRVRICVESVSVVHLREIIGDTRPLKNYISILLIIKMNPISLVLLEKLEGNFGCL